jgi:hypothetical protein
MRRIAGQEAITLTEMMIAISFTVFLMMGVYGFYSTSGQEYNAGIKGQTLQDGANIILSKITRGDVESGTVYRLETGSSYLIPNGVTPALYTCGGASQTAPCNATWTSSELYYCQDSPCTPTDTTARWYYLNSTGTAVMYHYPGEAGNNDISLYTAPTGSTMSLRFVSATSSTNVIRIDAALNAKIAANVTNLRLAYSGAVTNYILLRNHT